MLLTEMALRGIFTESSWRPLLVTPTPQQIERIQGNPKSEYFSDIGTEPVLVPEEIRSLEFVPEELENYSLRKLFGRALVTCVEERFGNITSTAQEGSVGLRGTACSVEERIDYTESWVASITPWREEECFRHVEGLEEILNGKPEYGGRRVRMEPLSLSNPGRAYKLGKFPNAWLFRHPARLREKLQPTGIDSSSVFPVLIFHT